MSEPARAGSAVHTATLPPCATVFTRTSPRVYTHAILVRHPDGRVGAFGWSSSEALATAAARSLQKALDRGDRYVSGDGPYPGGSVAIVVPATRGPARVPRAKAAK